VQKWPPRNTIRLGFLWSGDKCSKEYAVATETWRVCYSARCNITSPQSPGPRPELAGCEASIADVRLIIAGFREKGITVTTANIRAVFVSQLTAQGDGHLLSPHLTDKLAEPDPNRLLLTTK
jgi:hypothetical protein